MTIRETIPLNIPKELHEKAIDPQLLRESGISAIGDSAKFILSHVVVTANRMGGVWYGYAVHPSVQVRSEADVLGGFIENDPVDAHELLDRAEGWIRGSDTVEFAPGPMAHQHFDDPDIAMGHILVRATDVQL